MDSVYHLIINIGILLSTPFLLVKMGFDRSFRKDIMGRFFTHRKLLVQKGCIWIHASSVGEVRAANILIQGMKALGMQKPIVLSTFTLTGYELARKEGLLEPVPVRPMVLNALCGVLVAAAGGKGVMADDHRPP